MTSLLSYRVAVPALAELAARARADGGAVGLPGTEWTLARARAAASCEPDWRGWLLEGSGLGDDACGRLAAGPCTFAACTGQPPTGTWARAEPVHLLTAIDHLQLASPVPLSLEPEESAALLATLNAHLAGSGFALRQSATGGWLCECPPGIDFRAAEPVAAVGRNLRDLLPSGRDAIRVRALVNELQMLLHEHPVNLRRVSLGRPVVNSVWLWGAGAAGVVQGTATAPLCTDDDWLTGLWRLHGGRALPLAELASAATATDREVRVAVAPRATGRAAIDELQEIERLVFRHLRAELGAGRAAVALHTGRDVRVCHRRARWAFWRRPRPICESFR
jgi:hypothetical protein